MNDGVKHSFEKIAADIDNLRNLLEGQDIEITFESPFEAAYYLAQELSKSADDFLIAVEQLGGDEYDQYTAMRDINGVHLFALLFPTFEWTELAPFHDHISMLSTGSSSHGSRCAPSDDEGRKLLELLVGMIFYRISDKVELAADDDDTQENPDVLGAFDGQNWGFACKVFQGSNPQTHADRIIEGLEQVEESTADVGTVVFSLRNCLAHEDVFDHLDEDGAAFASVNDALAEINDQIDAWWCEVKADIEARDIDTVPFEKTSPTLLAYIESNVLLERDQRVCTTLRFFRKLYWGRDGADSSVVRMGTLLNEALHNRLPWSSAFAYSFNNQGPRNKTFLQHSEPRTCRFCNRDEDAASFKKEAHVVPAALGNRTLFSNEECDECNHAFGSSIENDFINSLAFVRALARKRSRKGHVKHKPAGGNSFIKSGVSSDVVKIALDEGSQTINVEQLGDGELRVSCQVPSYRPINIAKTLAKMALMVLPNHEVEQHEHLLRWLEGSVNWQPTFYSFTIPGTGFTDTTLMVRRFISGRRVWFFVSLSYSFRLLILPLPTPQWELPTGLSMEEMFGDYEDLVQPIEFREMTESTRVSNVTESITMTFDNVDRLTPEELQEIFEGDG